MPASGKSVLAEALADASALPPLSSDLIRKRLARVPIAQRAPTATYSAEWNARTYSELGQSAAAEAVTHGGVIIDATFRHRPDRDLFEASFESAAPLVFVECRPRFQCSAAARGSVKRDRSRVSDADLPAVIREQAAWDPLDEVPAEAHLVVRTDRPVPEIVADVMALLDQRLTRCTDRRR